MTSKFLESLLLPLGVLVFSLALLVKLERDLWQSLPDTALDRYALDLELPSPPEGIQVTALWSICTRHPFRQTMSLLATCVDRDITDDDTVLDQLEHEWSNALHSQLEYASAAPIIDLEPVIRQVEALRTFQRQHRFETEMRWPFSGHPSSNPTVTTTTTASASPFNFSLLLQTWKRSRSRHEDRLTNIEKIANRSERVRALGLLATGWSLEYNYAAPVAEARLIPDRQSLAFRLEQLRRARGHATNALTAIDAYLPTIVMTSGMAILAAMALRAAPIIVSVICLVAGIGAIHLFDLALTGPEALRHLPHRSFSTNTLTLGDIVLWIPALIFVLFLIAARVVSRSQGWSRFLRLPWKWFGLLFAFLALITWIYPLSSALRTEFFSMIASIGGALFIARRAPMLETASGAMAASATPVLFVSAIALLMSASTRVDPVGTLAISGLVILILLAILGGRRTRLLALAAFIFAIWSYVQFLGGDATTTELLRHFPRHAAERLLVAQDALNHGAPDVAQATWLIASAMRPGEEGPGWGLGHVPWLGFPGIRRATPLPLPAAADLSFAVAAAIGGLGYALILVSSLLIALILLIRRGLRVGLAAQRASVGQRFLATLGAIGLLFVVLRAVTSVGGNLGILPLAGLPIVPLAYAPAATLFLFSYIGVLLGSITGDGGDHDR